MQKLSIAIITYNEVDRIGRALESIRFADEILVVDGGSTDETVALCRAFGARVLSRPFDGFVSQKQFALEQASHPWVLSLDADEQVSPSLALSIHRVLEATDLRMQGFTCARRNFYLGVPIRFAGWYPDRKLRLVQRATACWTGLDPHDRLEVTGKVGHLEGDLFHHSYRDLADHARKISRYAVVWAHSARSVGRRAGAIDLALRPLHHFVRRFLLAQGFREGLTGLVLCTMGAYSVFLKYACLLELQKKDDRLEGER